MRGGASLFDRINKEDYILAFFPCTRFEARVPLLSRGEAFQQKKWDDIKKLEYSKMLVKELNHNYQLIADLFIICKRKNLKLIVENPYSHPHFLTDYFPIKPKIIHNDRSLYGDYFKKPTQYWFYNCEPKENFFFENLQTVGDKIKKIDFIHDKAERSMISPTYANRFIREFIM